MKNAGDGQIIAENPNTDQDVEFIEISSTPRVFYEVNHKTCDFEKCGLSELKGKKWESVEDAGILLCTKAPEKVDCLKYNNEYRKLLKLKQDLQYEGVYVNF